MKHTTRLLALLLIPVSFLSFTRNTLVKPKRILGNDTIASSLVVYGEYVFKRESCSNCHTLGQTDNPELVSLDGMKKKYNNDWHFLHLQDPQALVYDSKMPAFGFLNDKALNRETFNQIVTTNQNIKWSGLLSAADSMYVKLKSADTKAHKRTEILALIAYLQTIPASSAMIKKDSLINDQLVHARKEWDKQWENVTLDFSSMTKDNNHIAAGKTLYKANCIMCHGDSGAGSIGPNLTDDYWLHGSGVNNMANTIRNGVPDRGMIAWQDKLTPLEVGQLIAYIKAIQGSNPKNAKMQQGKKE